MKRYLPVFALLAFAGCESGLALRSASNGREAGPAALQGTRGEQLYVTHCATCHGTAGLGDGDAARYLFPKPRDFTKGAYKVRSTATGALPLDRDLFDTITNGMPGSAMPSFGFLSEADRNELVAQLKTFAVVTDENGLKTNLWKLRGEPKAVPVGAPPAITPELVGKGQAAYNKLQCALCHGALGEGDGLSAKTLRDDWGYPAPPNNFTRGIYKGGGTDRDVYLRFTTGMAGTPMPSFEKQLSDEERWALVAYVKSMAGAKVAKQSVEGKLDAVRVDKLPENPFDPAWDKIAATELTFMLIFQRQEKGEAIAVRAAHDGKSIAIMMDWTDLTCDSFVLRPQDFADGAAVQFAMPGERGHFAMGEKGRPVNIWHWRIDRQVDLSRHVDMEDYYPGMVSDNYPMEHEYGTKQDGWPPANRTLPAQDQDKTFVTGWGAGNPASSPHKTSSVQDLNAAGFGTLEPQPVDDQNVTGRGVWTMGRWKVVFVRPLDGKGDKDVKLRSGSTVDVAFAVWDGSARDRDGQKSVTVWQKLTIK